mmetsp:Transcript_8364/g.31253  ORF Transcript_8364/g.31253 Transcript_8364/m.31253 type:complete len:241 (-) Transcript_8364:38-760(-)
MVAMQKISLASIRMPTTRTRTSASFLISTVWSDETYLFSPTDSNVMSSSMSWFETNRFNGPASAKNPNLFTCVTVASRTSPLNGRNATHPYSTWYFALAVPSSVTMPSETRLICVTITMKPWRPVQLPSTSFLSFSRNTSCRFFPKCRGSRMTFFSCVMWKNILTAQTVRARAVGGRGCVGGYGRGFTIRGGSALGKLLAPTFCGQVERRGKRAPRSNERSPPCPSASHEPARLKADEHT